METIIDKAKGRFLKMVLDNGSDPYWLTSHLTEVCRWANFFIKRYPEIDSEILFLGVWLHDIGHYPIDNEDHAAKGEKIAKEFLSKENYPLDKLNRVLHCVRSHRCKDVAPASFEAKVLAFIDSASHITDLIYFKMAKSIKEKREDFSIVYSKMERDYRDLSFFPEIQEELKHLYEAWKNLIEMYEKIIN